MSKISLEDVQAGRYFVKNYMVREIIEDLGDNISYYTYILDTGEPRDEFRGICSKYHITRWAEREATLEEISRMKHFEARIWERNSSNSLAAGILRAAPEEWILNEIQLRSKIEYNVFMSYARTDVDAVQGIYEFLLKNGHHPWMDVHSIKAGENWFRAINKAIDECEIFLAILSNNSVSRRGIIQKELKKALDKWEGMLPNDIYLIPIRIDDCPIPDLLKHLQVLEWDNGKGETKLLEAIRVGLARRKAGG